MLVDGTPAIFSYFQGGWSSKIKFDFHAAGAFHPVHGPNFQTKYWTNVTPGVVQYGSGGLCSKLKVHWVLPGSDFTGGSQGRSAAGRQGHSAAGRQGRSAAGRRAAAAEPDGESTWRVVLSSTVLVRKGPDLDSEKVASIKAGTKLNVHEGCFIEDTDKTARLRISEPQEGWVTPYLASSKRVLILPPTSGNLDPQFDGHLRDIAVFLLANSEE